MYKHIKDDLCIESSSFWKQTPFASLDAMNDYWSLQILAIDMK
jgi:hypothetical protein